MRQDSGVHNGPGSFCSRREGHTGASAWGGTHWQRDTYAVTLGARRTAGALGSRGPSGAGEAGSTSNARSAL